MLLLLEPCYVFLQEALPSTAYDSCRSHLASSRALYGNEGKISQSIPEKLQMKEVHTVEKVLILNV